MGAWTYCKRCEEGLNRPTPREVVEESIVCPTCGFSNPPGMTQGELLLDLIERVEELEKNQL